MKIEFQDEQQAIEAFEANVTLRYIRIDAHERWADGTQYEGLQSWWDDKDDKPLWERAPCVVYPVVKIAARSNVDLCLGEGRFPSFTARPGEDEQEEDGGLNEDDSSILDRFLRHYHKVSKFRAHSRDCFYSSQTGGSVATIYGIRDNKPFCHRVPAKWCEPAFDQDGNVTKLEIKYPYVEEYRKGGKWAKRTKLYRRVIDDKNDTEFFPADANVTGMDPVWKKNPERSVEHGFGFCPVVWYALMKGTTTVNVIDGKPIHDKLQNEIRAHDIARSQWHRGALMSEPQICEFGVPQGYSPTETGRVAFALQSEGDPVKFTDDNGAIVPGQMEKVTGAFIDAKSKGSPARKKGPGFVWQYTSKDQRVETLEIPEGALKAQENNCRDLRIKLQEALAVVFLDPENIKFAATTSGKALIAIKQKQIDRCDQFRDDLSDEFFEPSLSMQLRIAQKFLSKGGKLRVPGATKVKPILDRFIGDDNAWEAPSLSVEYGPYTKPDPEEQQKIVALVQTALGGKGGRPLINLQTAVKRVAKIFGIENVQALIDELEKAEEDALANSPLTGAVQSTRVAEAPASTPPETEAA